jgi:hypothetical protein
MAKILMKCPFSSKACVECAIYRGRHFYLYSAKRYCGHERDMLQHSGMELPRTPGKKGEIFNGLTDFPASSRMISDVEDRIEGEESSKFKEKGETHDT